MDLNIGICDDSSEQIVIIKKYIKDLAKKHEIKVVSSTNPLDFHRCLKKNKPDLVFLDIDMEEMDGIELGKKLKEEYNDTVIVYITAYERYALDAFQVRAFHYLIKPLTIEKFARVFEEALNQVKIVKEEKGYFLVKKKGEYIKFNYEKIYYFEKIHNKIKIDTTNRKVTFYGTFKNLLPKLDENIFIRCHQGYIVNINKVRAYRNQMLLLEKELKKIPVSRSNIRKVKEMMEKRLFS